MYIDCFTVYLVFPEHIVGTSTVSDDEYVVKVDQWLKDRPVEEVQPSTEGRAVSVHVIDDRIGTLSKAWRDRELAEQDLRLTPDQMKWLKDKAPKCPIKYDNTDLLVKPSSCAGFDEEALRSYIIHELSKMPALAQVCDGVKKFCLMDISRPCIKCPYTRELMPLGRALVPPYNEINRELKVTCGKAAASALTKFIKDSVLQPTIEAVMRRSRAPVHEAQPHSGHARRLRLWRDQGSPTSTARVEKLKGQRTREGHRYIIRR